MPDIFWFYGEAGTDVLIELVSEEFDPYVVLLDSDWNVVATDDDGGSDLNAQVYTTLPKSGAYYVLAGESIGYSDGEGGPYTLYLDMGDAAEEAFLWCGFGRSRTPWEFGLVSTYATTTEHFSTWDAPSGCDPAFDLLSFEARAGDSVVIEAVSTDFDTVLILADANLATLAEDDDSAGNKNARIETTVEADGLYYVKVMGYWPDSYGYYSVSVSVNGGGPDDLDELWMESMDERLDGPSGEPSDETGGAGPVPLSPWGLDPAVMPDCYELWEANALFLESGDWLYEHLDDNEAFARKGCATRLFSYSFDAEEGEEALIEIYSEYPRTYLALYDAHWQLVATSDTPEEGYAGIFQWVPQAGRYFIVAGAYDADYSPGDYVIYLDVGCNLMDRCWTEGTLELAAGHVLVQERDLSELPSYCDGLSDMYAFSGTAGETVVLEISSDTFLPFLELYDADFVPLAAAESAGGESETSHWAVIAFTLPETGLYYVQANVISDSHETAGSYSLRFDRFRSIVN